MGRKLLGLRPMSTLFLSHRFESDVEGVLSTLHQEEEPFSLLGLLDGLVIVLQTLDFLAVDFLDEISRAQLSLRCGASRFDA